MSLDDIYNSQVPSGEKDADGKDVMGPRTRSSDAEYNPLLYAANKGADGKDEYKSRFGGSLKDFVTSAMGGDKFQGWKEARNTLGQTKALQYLYPTAGTMDAFTMNAEMPRSVLEAVLNKPGDMKEEDILPTLEKRFGTKDPYGVEWDMYDSATLGGRNAIENVQTTMDPLARIGSRNNPRELLGEYISNPEMDLMKRDKEISKEKRKAKKDGKSGKVTTGEATTKKVSTKEETSGDGTSDTSGTGEIFTA